jgi:hypothetical protein
MSPHVVSIFLMSMWFVLFVFITHMPHAHACTSFSHTYTYMHTQCAACASFNEDAPYSMACSSKAVHVISVYFIRVRVLYVRACALLRRLLTTMCRLTQKITFIVSVVRRVQANRVVPSPLSHSMMWSCINALKNVRSGFFVLSLIHTASSCT